MHRVQQVHWRGAVGKQRHRNITKELIYNKQQETVFLVCSDQPLQWTSLDSGSQRNNIDADADKCGISHVR